VFAELPRENPDLFPGTTPRILSCDREQSAISSMIGNMRTTGLTGPEREGWIVVQRRDVRELTPAIVRDALPDANMESGVFCVNPPYGKRLLGGEENEAELLALYADFGRAFGRFRGWRACVFAVHPGFIDAFGHEPRIVKPASNADLRGWFLVF
jgi:23S rRNA G2445 N2-methylase RlmL